MAIKWLLFLHYRPWLSHRNRIAEKIFLCKLHKLQKFLLQRSKQSLKGFKLHFPGSMYQTIPSRHQKLKMQWQNRKNVKVLDHKREFRLQGCLNKAKLIKKWVKNFNRKNLPPGRSLRFRLNKIQRITSILPKIHLRSKRRAIGLKTKTCLYNFNQARRLLGCLWKVIEFRTKSNLSSLARRLQECLKKVIESEIKSNFSNLISKLLKCLKEVIGSLIKHLFLSRARILPRKVVRVRLA